MKVTYLYILLIFIALSSCDDMQDVARESHLVNENSVEHLLILSEGLTNMNNSTLCEYRFSTGKIINDYFSQVNKRGLGDTANDMILYGGNIYISINVSSQIEVIDANTGLSVKRIPLFDEKNVARQPRYLTSHNGYVYATNYDGYLSKIDTTSLSVIAQVKCGKNPEGLCIANNKIYVANSGGLDFPHYDHTISVIDIKSFKELRKIEVGINPYKIFADSQNDVYVCTRGNYTSEPYRFIKIDSEIDQVVDEFKNLNVLNFTLYNDKAYLYSYDFNRNTYWIKIFDCLTEQIINEDFIKDKTTLQTPYSIQINPFDENIYITDAINFTVWGDVLCFDKTGNLKFKLTEMGLNPNKVLFRN